MDTQYRAQLVTDKIFQVTEEWSEMSGAYQVAKGVDVDGNEITLCNAGFSQFPNYVVTEVKLTVLERLFDKRMAQTEKFSALNTREGRCLAYFATQRARNLRRKIIGR